MEIIHKWLFKTSTGKEEFVDISGENPEVDDFVNSITENISDNKSTKSYKTRSDRTEVLSCIKRICAVELSNDKFHDNALLELEKIARRLIRIEQETDRNYGHLNPVQKGELLLVLLKDNNYYKFLLSKVEVVDILTTENEVSVTYGITKEIKRLWKSCIIDMQVSSDDDTSYHLAEVYSSTNSNYWHHRFLELDELTTDELNTERAFRAIDSVLTKVIKKESKNDHLVLRNAFIQYFRRGDVIDYDLMISEIVDNYQPSDARFTIDKRRILSQKLLDLPDRGGNFDRLFESKPDILKVRIKKTFPLTNEVDLVIKDGIENIRDVIKVEEDPIQGMRLIVKVDNADTFKTFETL